MHEERQLHMNTRQADQHTSNTCHEQLSVADIVAWTKPQPFDIISVSGLLLFAGSTDPSP